ncbi:MAG: DivIVA domain-containing protein [Candidatus Edwardsbacteria bacterium]
MKITPLDIRKQSFRKKVRGLDPDEVQAFLEMVANEFEELIKENTTLTERLQNAESTVEDYRRMERTLQDTLMNAQKTSDELRQNAEKRAELTVKEAQIKVEQMIAEARSRFADLQRQISDLKNQRQAYLTKFRSLLETHLEMLQYQEMESGMRVQTQIFDTKLSLTETVKREEKIPIVVSSTQEKENDA